MNRWAERWVELLDDGSLQVARRLSRGGQLLRSGRVTAVRVAPGAVSGRVQGSHATPLAVEVLVPVLDEAQWATLVGVLAQQVRHRARLLAGQVPEGLEAEVAAAGVALMPRREELDVRCGCGDETLPCAHAAAVLQAVAELIGTDPFALLRIRGRGRDRLLADTAAARRRTGGAAAAPGADPASLDPHTWTVAGGEVANLELALEPPPRTVAGPLRLLGDPPGWAGAQSPGDLFAPMVVGAAEWAAALVHRAEAE